MVERLATRGRRVEEHGELLAHVALPDELGESPRAQRARGVLVAAILRHGEPLVAHRAGSQHGERRAQAVAGVAARLRESLVRLRHAESEGDERLARRAVLAVAVAVAGHDCRTGRPDALAQLEREPLGELAADARDARQLRDVAVDDRAPHDRGAVHREDRERDPRADARHPAQEVEEIALVDVGEAVQRERVLADDELGLQRYELGRLAGAPGRRGRGVDAQADASDLDHEPVDVLDGKPPAQARDHRAVRERRLARRPRMAERDGERIRGVLGRRLALEAEDRDDHPADLLLRRAPEAADRALHLGRRVLGRGDSLQRHRLRARPRAPDRPRGSRADRGR